MIYIFANQATFSEAQLIVSFIYVHFCTLWPIYMKDLSSNVFPLYLCSVMRSSCLEISEIMDFMKLDFFYKNVIHK